MLLTLVIILILIGAAVVGSLYSNFLVFYQNFTETENYHKARYAAIAATERAELAIKQREPGYIGSGGWMLGENGSTGGFAGSDQIISGFSYLSNDNSSVNKSTIFWDINSRADRIPAISGGNVEKLLSDNDSPNYNMMDYENAEVVLLYYDDDHGNPYKKTDTTRIKQSKLGGITVSIRLPPYIKSGFGLLNTDTTLIPGGYTDDALVDRQLRGKFDDKDFTILATQNAAGAGEVGASDNDSAIRESDLNNGSGVKLEFEIYRNPKKSNNATPTVISPEDSNIKNLVDETTGLYGFKKLLNNTHASYLELRLSLLNLVLGTSRYPFLEYSIQFKPYATGQPVVISDKYYTIKTEGNYGDYKIDTVIYKPTIVESILRSFTTIL